MFQLQSEAEIIFEPFLSVYLFVRLCVSRVFCFFIQTFLETNVGVLFVVVFFVIFFHILN